MRGAIDDRGVGIGDEWVELVEAMRVVAQIIRWLQLVAGNAGNTSSEALHPVAETVARMIEQHFSKKRVVAKEVEMMRPAHTVPRRRRENRAAFTLPMYKKMSMIPSDQAPSANATSPFKPVRRRS